MKKAIFRPDGNHVLINTGHQLFDQHCDILCPGNVWGNAQYSNYVYPKNTVAFNGHPFVPGQVRDADLRAFRHLPAAVRRYVESVTDQESVILYQFRHPTHRGTITDGYIVTRKEPECTFLQMFVVNPRGGRRILETVAPYVSDYPEEVTRALS